MARPRPSGARIGSIVLALSLMLLISACADTSAGSYAKTPNPTLHPAIVATPQANATPSLKIIKALDPPTAGKAVVWRRANLPAGFGLQLAGADLQIAQSDGTTAYSCAPLVGKGVPVVVTHDAGISWQRTAALPDAKHLLCNSIAVDMLNPSIVVAQSLASDSMSDVSFDGGHSWKTLSKAAGYVFKLATRNGRTVVLLNQSTVPTFLLEESNDQMRTWHRIDSDLSGGDIQSFALNPATGSIIVIAERGILVSDDGAHWTQLPPPVYGRNDYMVPQPVGAGPWRACSSYFADASGTTVDLACTLDGGKTWEQLPDLAGNTEVVGIAPDRAILAAPTLGGSDPSGLYRLAQGATRWQKLGSPPPHGATIVFVPSRSGGMLWVLPAESSGGPISDKPNDVYSAPYPY